MKTEVDLRQVTTDAPLTTPLEKALQTVRDDSQRDADSYLDETTVPHGGE